MTDLREKQPDRSTIDMTRETSGSHTWAIELWVAPYFGIKSENVYARRPTYLVNAMTFNDAASMARVLRAALLESHDIWSVNIEGVNKA